MMCSQWLEVLGQQIRPLPTGSALVTWRWARAIVESCIPTSTAVTGRPIEGRSVRRLARHRGADDRDLLSAALSGATAVRPQCQLLPHCRRGPARRIPRLEALPTRRVARLTGRERERRCGCQGHAIPYDDRWQELLRLIDH